VRSPPVQRPLVAISPSFAPYVPLPARLPLHQFHRTILKRPLPRNPPAHRPAPRFLAPLLPRSLLQVKLHPPKPSPPSRPNPFFFLPLPAEDYFLSFLQIITRLWRKLSIEQQEQQTAASRGGSNGERLAPTNPASSANCRLLTILRNNPFVFNGIEEMINRMWLKTGGLGQIPIGG
jgi:hypothetical protein